MKLISTSISFFLLSATSFVVTATPQRRSDINEVVTAETPDSSIIDNLLDHNATILNTVKAFDGIIFGNFEAQTGTQRFNGSLAVQGNFTATNFKVNSDRTIDCPVNTTAVSLDSFGLVIGGALTVKNATVNGASYHASGSVTAEGIKNNDCNRYANIDFNVLQNEARTISKFFANQRPNMVIRDVGYLTDGEYTSTSNQDYYIYTFNKCAEKFCELPNYLYSDSEEIFNGGNWTGPYNANYPKDKPIIFNIPVQNNSFFNMSTANPAAGLEGAAVLYNVYPATATGAYDPSGHVVWLRNTTHIINGFMLAPSAFVVENNIGGFNGHLVASQYLSVLENEYALLNSNPLLYNALLNNNFTLNDRTDFNNNITTTNNSTTPINYNNTSTNSGA
ncbi:hypothetical protein BDF20DRAFT_844383 [Mycotypha africana]|uniref:uncharacterized protein n=1 Tax=Mycotypha africana TaxID=64632 RepID=UPI0022FFDA02|nr:uncharacterized protein BDF20DRAFT_844383 [Mycotypha africana]KAI8991391.1 hypothetical protein BDF20DRAFT_844383 [Mycotypha africana]